MNEQTNQTTSEHAATFQKIWMETVSKTMQAAFTFTPNSPPPEVLRQVRSSIFQALGESWEKFMRSPEFLETMKRWMEQAVTFRKSTNELLGKVRHEMQAPSREDIKTIMLAVRHGEKRLLDRMDQLAAQIDTFEMSQGKRNGGAKARKAPRTAKRTVKSSRVSAAKPSRHHD